MSVAANVAGPHTAILSASLTAARCDRPRRYVPSFTSSTSPALPPVIGAGRCDSAERWERRGCIHACDIGGGVGSSEQVCGVVMRHGGVFKQTVTQRNHNEPQIAVQYGHL
ncbi:MAG: hypothetical protein J7463_10050 [Roseiflexus sp.]|nr:hypothetical protein [Roseiflexus sp.]